MCHSKVKETVCTSSLRSHRTEHEINECKLLGDRFTFYKSSNAVSSLISILADRKKNFRLKRS